MVRLQLEITDIEIVKLLEVSIPLWFDYNTFLRERLNLSLFCLNSTMVRLQPYQLHRAIHRVYRSQFHYGSITTFYH